MNRQELLEFSQEHADKNGLKLNSDTNNLNLILDGILKNESKTGFRFCPCKLHVKENICPCKDHKKEIKELGHCKCTLFWKLN